MSVIKVAGTKLVKPIRGGSKLFQYQWYIYIIYTKWHIHNLWLIYKDELIK
jgi:hypothetical protein